MRIQAQLKRILDIMFLINDSRYGWTVDELSKRYSVHPRTISREMTTLSAMMLAASKEGKWYGLSNTAVTKLQEQSCKSANIQ